MILELLSEYAADLESLFFILFFLPEMKGLEQNKAT